MNDHLAAPVRDLLALYAEKYPEVRFADIDLSVLERAAEGVAEAVAKVAEAEASIAPLREEVKVAEAELTQKVVRALSFLKIHVEGDEEQYARLDALTAALLVRRIARKSAEAAPAGTGRKRGRKPKEVSLAQSEGAEPAVSEADLAEADLPSSALTEFEPVAQ
jgi:hypothetical protein